jgi:hypothetical protein
MASPAQVLHGEAATAGVLAEGLSDEALTDAARACDDHALMRRDPAVLRELEELLLA